MDPRVAALERALRELTELIESADGEDGAGRSRLIAQMEAVRKLGVELPDDQGRLKHFIERRSYQRALEHIEGSRAGVQDDS